ncbi:MAG: ABC transporter ATP-binding protein [Bacillota bacterium]|jgi:ATP-binding cassette subfamily B multidrug efflux pump
MLKLLKYLKKSTMSIILIILLLLGQAMCDLALPSYTSDLVNIGIQQGGIKDATLQVIRQSELHKLLLLMNKEDAGIVLSSYSLLNSKSLSKADLSSYREKYPQLVNEPLYILNEQADQRQLNIIWGKAIMSLEIITGKSEMAKDLQYQLSSRLSVPPEADLLQVIAAMPEASRYQLIDSINENFANMPESMIIQSSVAYVKAEYNAIGIDTASKQIQYVLITGLKMIIITLLSMGATVLVILLSSKVGAFTSQDLRIKVFKKVLSFSHAEMNRFSTASLITRSTNDIQQIQLMLIMLMRIFFYAPIIGVGAFIKATASTPSMSWIIGISVLALLSLVMILFVALIPKFKIMQKLIDKLNMISREILTGLPVIRAFSNQKHEEKRFDKANRDLMRVNLFVNRTMALMMPLIFLVMDATSVLIVWKGAYGIEQGLLQVGDMMAFIQYTMMIIISFLMISMVSVMMPRATVAAGRINEILNTSISIQDPEQIQPFDEQKKGYVEFRDVCFRYPQAEEDALSHITFTALPGQITAFIGGTGSGKSTLVNLIPRFFDVTSGQILVDGQDVKQVTLHDLRAKIGYVPQKSTLFSGTIESNIKYGKRQITDHMMEEAAQIAQANDFISQKEDGFQSSISHSGLNISGGQKQRLSIARAIAGQPEIYIFDDSFSALDYKTDRALRRALKEKISDSTVLIVAQRISTIMNADQIIVIDKGKIVAQGTHRELLQSCEIYRQLAYSQLSEEELAHG